LSSHNIRLTPAPEVWDWLQAEILADTGSIHNEDHAHLLDADIRVMWASSSFEKQGRTVLGQAEQVAFRAGGWQKARMEQQMRDWFAEQAGLHKDDLAAIAKAASAQARAEQNKRLAIENYPMLNATRLFCAIALPLLMCGCQSSLPTIQPVAATCLPPPAPSAWFMQPVEPNLTQRMLKELSASPTPATKD
jgi:hypothetical protein